MSGTVKTQAQLLAEFAPGQGPNSITPQSMLDLIVSVMLESGNFNDLPTSPAGLTTGRIWRNGTVLNVVP